MNFFQSPFGIVQVSASNQGVTAVKRVSHIEERDIQPNTHTTQAIEELKAYFRKELQQFKVALDYQGTPFQQQVWEQLLGIPYGTTTSYKQIAKNLGDVKKIRAVGSANGKNKIWIIIPCHRVIGENGDLIGYAGGITLKRQLLSHEATVQQLSIF